jgi:glutaconate CoA-transferase subunit A
MVDNEDTIALGGLATSGVPMAFVRGVIKARLKDLTAVHPAAGGIDVDMLIGAGCVKKVISAYMGADWLCPILPNFRSACEKGEIEVWESDEGLIDLALEATIMEVPFMPTKVGLGTDLPKLNLDLKEFKSPIKGERLIAVPALKPDIAVVHVGLADVYGNGVHVGPTYGDSVILKASEKVILTAEEIVPNKDVRSEPRLVSVPGEIVDAVVKVPYGAHPCACHRYYREDVPHIMRYVKAAEDVRKGTNPEALKIYLDKFLYDIETHGDYLELIGAERLIKLKYY